VAPVGLAGWELAGWELAGWELAGVALLVGSFLGVVIDRLPDRLSLLGRSRCRHCAATLTARDLAPLASWLAGGGRCRHCGAWIGWFYPAVEVAALGIAVVALLTDRGLDAWTDAVLGWWLLALGWIDWRRCVLPDVLTLPLLALGLAAAWGLAPGELRDRTAGAACGFLGLWAVAWLYRRLRGRDGLGLGDAKLLAASGAWVGLSGLPSVLAGGALAALVAAGAMMLAGRRLDRYSALPFGPFLAAATWLVWLFGQIAL
jgi:leader peptidase (prepilin peptidase) / N-methyltransferase